MAIAVIALCLIILGGVGVLVVYPQIKAARHWRQAQEAIDRFDLKEAREHLDACLEVWRDSGETEFLMARTCRRADDLDAAREHLQKAKRLHWVPQQIQLESFLIQAQTFLQPWIEEKLKGYLQEGNADERFILEALVVGSLKGNLFNKALQWTAVWLEHRPDDWEAHWWRGRVLQAGKAFAPAAKELAKALELNPQQPGPHFHLAQVYLSDNHHRDALPHFQEFLQIDPNNPVALLGLAHCQQAEGLSRESRATLAKLFEIQPENGGGFLLEGQLALEEDNFHAAKEWLAKALNLNPNDLQANQDMARVLRHEAAILENENRKSAAEEKRREAERYEKKYQEINNADNRVLEIVRELMVRPGNPVLLTEAGTTLMALGRIDEAFRWLEGALLVDPNYQPAKDALGKCLKQVGDRRLEELYQPILRDDLKK